MKALRFPAGLYGVTPEWDDTERLMRAVRQAAEGGMRALQLRRKDVPDAVRAEQARALAPLCRELGVVFLINDDWRLALEVGAVITGLFEAPAIRAAAAACAAPYSINRNLKP